jgi:hypothetical protein
MKQKLLLVPLALFSSILIYAQDYLEIKGKIISESSNLDGIHVINKTKKNGVVSERGGYFIIPASENDTLMFSAVHLEAVTYVVKKGDFNKELLFIQMNALINKLDEVIITEYKNINAVALGIIPADQKTYTPAERKLKTASEMTVGTIVSLDAIINSISGRTSMLKKEVKIERKEMLMEKIVDYFNEDYIEKTLKIPFNYVEGFLFYAVENEELVSAIKNKNKAIIGLILNDLALNYLTLLKEIQD